MRAARASQGKCGKPPSATAARQHPTDSCWYKTFSTPRPMPDADRTCSATEPTPGPGQHRPYAPGQQCGKQTSAYLRSPNTMPPNSGSYATLSTAYSADYHQNWTTTSWLPSNSLLTTTATSSRWPPATPGAGLPVPSGVKSFSASTPVHGSDSDNAETRRADQRSMTGHGTTGRCGTPRQRVGP